MSDDALKNIMADYMSPIKDDGFSDLVMMRADAKRSRHAKLRSRSINAAFFFGGIIAAVQIPKGVSVLQSSFSGRSLPSVDMPNDVPSLDMAMSMPFLVGVAIVLMAGFMMWSVLDADGIG